MITSPRSEKIAFRMKLIHRVNRARALLALTQLTLFNVHRQSDRCCRNGGPEKLLASRKRALEHTIPPPLSVSSEIVLYLFCIFFCSLGFIDFFDKTDVQDVLNANVGKDSITMKSNENDSLILDRIYEVLIEAALWYLYSMKNFNDKRE